ncbi:hypothetical protein Ato02nite_017650 [Paractinoplanes toevensis]|uniref:Uncharacterized protein n=1 Tax=Paractinoplanes toevensis TaxID=571911 RepID=A0A919VZC1_9ACTN|nr:hypothetical protein Ato02nite_017650 [Actinoplanes toevensis]
MSDQPWGVDANNPLDEGGEPTAVADGNLADQKAGADPTAQDGTRSPGTVSDRVISYFRLGKAHLFG